jgi:hypothetical protein
VEELAVARAVALEAGPVAAISLIDPTQAWAPDRDLERDRQDSVRDLELDRDLEPAQAPSLGIDPAPEDARRAAICKTSSICLGLAAETLAAADHRMCLETRRPDLAAHWLEVRPRTSCRIDRVIHCRGLVAGQAPVISQVRCPRGQVVAKDLAPVADDRM